MRANPPSPPVRQGLSLDHKLDIVGIFLVLVGLLTGLSLLSATNSPLTGSWVSGLRKAFGLGVYLFPGTLIVTGLWLVLRNFERIPRLGLERLLGIGLLFFNILAALHTLLLMGGESSSQELAQAGGGGGYTGALIYQALVVVLGTGGAAVALLAWLMIALLLILDVTVLEMAHRLSPWWLRLRDGAEDMWEDFRTGSPRGASDTRSTLLTDGFTPTGESPLYQEGSAAGAQLTSSSLPSQLAAAGSPFTSAQPPRRLWILPSVENILEAGVDVTYDNTADERRSQIIEDTLASFGAPVKVVEVNRGPTITQFGVEPDFIESRTGRMRVRVGKIAALADDLALALSARTIRIQAPVPGKGFVGIEVPNEEIALVSLRSVIQSEAFKRLKSPLRFALGLNVSGHALAADLAAMPHLLIAGATGSGKSVCVNALITGLLLHNTPDDLRLIMVDPKRVELTSYNGIPHLLAPVVVELERVVAALQWVLREMDMRYRKLAEKGCRNIQEYNARIAAPGPRQGPAPANMVTGADLPNVKPGTTQESRLPYLVVIIDELADLMMLAPDETERAVTRLAQLARATGIHLVIATQRPSVDVVTGLIKANFPARIAFAVASGVDSRVILDQPGAERLLGRGDMLFQAPDAAAPVRLQGVFVSDNEIQQLVNYWRAFAGSMQPTATAAGGIPDMPGSPLPLKQMPLWEEMKAEDENDPLLPEAVDLARRQGRASISMLQRRLRIGYTRSARLIETMESKGIIGPPEPGSGARQILDYGEVGEPGEE
ncbi:MAG: hypothetical protein A2Z16_01275 [Chloroflexi bacterium RBG_16_54_18]|nr:MAG: hypothetical protein A2Z16_01275 [Chloroflexi bacterium RBG_16_54_18]